MIPAPLGFPADNFPLCANSPLFSAAEPLGEDCHDLIVAAAAAGRAAGQLLHLGKLLFHVGEVRAPL